MSKLDFECLCKQPVNELIFQQKWRSDIILFDNNDILLLLLA